MQERLTRLESRLTRVEDRLTKQEKFYGGYAPPPPNSKEMIGFTWTYVDTHEVTEELVDNVLALYLGKNVASFTSYIESLAPFSLYLLGEGGSVASIFAAVVLKDHAFGTHIKLSIHKNRHYISEIAKLYLKLFASSERCYFAELSGPLEVAVRKNGVDNICDASVIQRVCGVRREAILNSEDDPRRQEHLMSDASPCPLGSYLVSATGKRLALYGRVCETTPTL